MSLSKCNYEAVQELFCAEYEKTHKQFPSKLEASKSKHELIVNIMRLKRIQRKHRKEQSA